jgi:hypothetical protein
MPRFTNNASLTNKDGNQTVKRYVHQPLSIDHNGIHAQIKENGKVLLTGPTRPVEGQPEVFEYDEIEIPASLVFKLAGLLKATRSVTFVPVNTVISTNDSIEGE